MNVVLELVWLATNRIEINNGVAKRANIGLNGHKVSRIILTGRSLNPTMGYHEDRLRGKRGKFRECCGELLPTFIADADTLNVIGAEVDDDNIGAEGTICAPILQSIWGRAAVDTSVDDDGPPNHSFLKDVGEARFCILGESYAIAQQ